MALALTAFGGSCKDSDDGSAPNIINLAVPVTTAPVDGATDVPINRKITATFNEAMSPATLNATTFTVTGPDAAPISGTVTYAEVGTTATFTPDVSLVNSTKFTATITTGAKSLTGHALAGNFLWSFTTGVSTDTIAPTVSSTIPLDAASGVAINANISVVFDEAMDPLSITAATYAVTGPNAAAVSGTLTYAGSTATFNPTSNLTPNTLYMATATTNIKDLAGNPLANDAVWTFTTGTTAAAGPSPVVLGTAGDYVILAKSAISTTGTTAVVGDLGLSPSAQSFVTGFSEALDATNNFAISSVVTGKIYAADMAIPTPAKLTTAISNMETAYTDAAGRTLPDFIELGAGDISGMTLVPGLYKWGTGVLMTSAITLSGSEHDIWIFQVAQDLTVSNGVIVTLAGGALAKNIFWQVAGQVTLGTTTNFKGILLSQTKIVLQTGAILNGRALAQTAVTLDANTVTQAAP